jgi:hypothetical protein
LWTRKTARKMDLEVSLRGRLPQLMACQTDEKERPELELQASTMP